MSKKVYLFATAIAVIVTLFILYKPINQKIFDLSYTLKTKLIRQKDSIENLYNQYRDQAKKIQELSQRVRELEPKALLALHYKQELQEISQELNLSRYEPSLYLVRLLSYAKLGNPNRLFLDFPKFKKNRNYGLVSNDIVAGVVKAKESKPLAILLYDKESVFSVSVGKEMIDGVAFGDGKEVVVKYIASYKKPKVGDEVVTSGYDGLFYYGIKVGRVIKVQKKLMYKEAIVKPYLPAKIPKYLYAVDVK